MQKSKELVFITGNEGKAKYLKDFLGIPVEHMSIDLSEIQSLSLREVVEDKANRAFEIVGRPVLVEDVSLTFKAMGKLPGPLVKWFLDSLKNEGLCRLLDQYQDRSAVAEVMFAYCSEEGTHVFQGSVKGSISKEPRGGGGFGWDAIFIPEGYEDTWGEMSAVEKHATSMRRFALDELKNFLENRKIEK